MAEPNLTGVSFKAVLRGGGGATDGDEVRRFNVDREVSTSLAYLQGKLVTLFPRLRRDAYAVSWVDADGDEVVVGSDEELVIALTEMKGPVYKIAVTIKGEKKPEFDFGSANGNNRGALHENVTCDGCEGAVRGFRYKCAVCPDYDLCGDCEAKGVHPGHNMMRIADPEQAWPQHFFRRLGKMHERAHRRAHSASHAAGLAAANRAAQASRCGASAAAAAEAGDKKEEGGHFYQQAFDPFMNGGQWVHGMGGGRGGGCRGRNRGRPGFGRCGAGGKMWEAMMKGWMGEEEMKARRESKYGPAEDGDNAKEAEEATKEATGEPVTSPFEDILTNLASGGGAEYLRNVGNLVAAALDPLGVDVQVDIEHNGKMSNVSKPASKEETPKEEDEAAEAKESPEEKSEEPQPQTEERKRSESPQSDKESLEGDWTVLNKSKDEVINIPVHVEGSEGPAQEQVDEAKDDGSRDVPINVSDKPAEVLFASPDGTLYPELPVQEASKVDKKKEDEREAEKAPAEPKGEKEKPKKVEQEDVKPSAPAASAVHPDPKIQVALQAMMNMGFSNDGGWLTQLLEAKNGDIGKVLDVLQPVRPVRN